MNKPWALISSFNSEISDKLSRGLRSRSVPCYSPSNHPSGEPYYSIQILSPSSLVQAIRVGTKTVVVAPESLRDQLVSGSYASSCKVYFYQESAPPQLVDASDQLVNLIFNDIFTYISSGDYYISPEISGYLFSSIPMTTKSIKPRPSISFSLPKVSISRPTFSTPSLSIGFSLKKLALAFSFIALALSLPFLSLTLSFASLHAADRLASRSLSTSKALTSVSSKLARLSERAPYTSEFYSQAILLSQAAEVGGRVLAASDQEVNSTQYEKLYLDSSFLLANLDTQSGLIPNSLSTMNLIDTSRNRLLRVAKFSPLADQLAGQDGERTYVVLLHDSDTMLGSIGEVESIYLFSIFEDNFTEYFEYSPEQFDEMILARVTPPSSLIDYWGQESWSMKYVGWSTDFEDVSKQVNKMTDLALGRTVNAVIAVDQVIVGGDIANEIANVLRLESNAVARFVEALDSKKILITSSDDIEQSLLSSEDWTGDIDLGEYGFSFAESSLEDTEVITDIRAQLSLVYDALEYKVNIKLSAQGPTETYVRVITPLSAQVKPFRLSGEPVTAEIVNKDNYREVGIYVELDGKKAQDLELEWTINKDFESVSQGSFVFNYQAIGDEGESKIDISINSLNPINLTESTSRGYNTNLSDDLETEVNWIRK